MTGFAWSEMLVQVYDLFTAGSGNCVPMADSTPLRLHRCAAEEPY